MPPNLEDAFPGLRNSDYIISSPSTPIYNCIAFAANETHRWWWPTAGNYWPPGISRIETLQSFIEAFGTLGYSACDDGTLESEFEKVAIFADDTGTPTHMARQHPSGIWTSKCGRDVDIEHVSVHALEGDLYGTVVQFLKRPYDSQPDQD